jgi:uncharacterized protein (DUF1800 family)
MTLSRMNGFAQRIWCAIFLFFFAGFPRSFAASAGDRFINISSRTQVGTGANVMIAGFVVGQGAPKKVLIRAVGPALTAQGVTGVLSDPVLTLNDSSGAPILTNDNWAAADAPVFAQAGAFELPSGSRDAVIVTTLNPGLYTAIVSGLSNTTGIALVEVYDVASTSRLINISTRAQVGSGAGVLISGIVVGQGGPRKVLLRAAGPSLVPLGVTGALSDPAMTLFNGSGTPIGNNDNWGSGDAAAMSAAFSQAGAFAFPAGSKDAALVVDLQPGSYTVHVAGVGNTTGVALLEAYDLTPGANSAGPAASVSATVAATAAVGSQPAVFTFSRSGDVANPLTVGYSLSGTAQSGTDYTGLTGSVSFPAGVSSVTQQLTALNTASSGSKTAVVTLNSGSGYEVGIGSAQATIYYGSGTLYLANMRTSAAAVNSTAYGTGTIVLTADDRFAYVNLSFSNLSSDQTVAYLRLSNSGEEGVQLKRLPNGQPTSSVWQISDSGGYTASQIAEAIKAGKVYISVETTNYPSGELRGTFVASAGSQTFSPPPAPPALPAGAPTVNDAARFLTQATFGPTKAEIDAVVQKGFKTWITEQMAAPQSVHRDATAADFTAFNTSATATKPGGQNRQAAWWKIAVTGQDQLRQRVAFALSEIFVVSDVNGSIGNWQEAAAAYYDMLGRDAFGNFRTLLEDVTLSPVMGVYLSHIRNSKATATTQPDENYAREVMQLFTIGLNQLQPDGTLKLDASGLPTSTYTQATITETAKVFTGWQFNNAGPTKSNFRSGGNTLDDYIKPMTLNPNFHEDAAKTIVNGVSLPASQGGNKDLKDTLDTLFNHPNTGPFICRQLIQRLVCSNPSPGYVYRVAQVFANNGSGTRGDLGAVVRAILLDYEARSTGVLGSKTYGKLKEPILRSTALLRAFDGATDSGRYPIFNAENPFAQAALRSPTVFNFFEPNYVVPGSLAAAGLYAPEFQILTDTTAISAPNSLYSTITANRGATTIGLSYAGLPPTSQPGAIVDYLNTVLCAGAMPTTIRDRIVTALDAMPTSATDNDKYRTAIYLTVATQEAAVQR